MPFACCELLVGQNGLHLIERVSMCLVVNLVLVRDRSRGIMWKVYGRVQRVSSPVSPGFSGFSFCAWMAIGSAKGSGLLLRF